MRRHPFFIIGMNKVFRFSFYLVILGCAFCTVFLIYFKGFPGPMLLDDQINLEHTKLYSLDRGSLLHVVTHNYSGILGRGFSNLTLGFTHFFNGIISFSFLFNFISFSIHCSFNSSLACFFSCLITHSKHMSNTTKHLH